MIDERLNTFINNEKGVDFRYYSLDHITAILHELDNPHHTIKSIHIAGTNGKGSTAGMLDKILKDCGYRTGLYTSPHLIRINERITVAGEEIDDGTFNRYIDLILDVIENRSDITPTYFDIVTVASLCYFRDAGVDIAIIECGLGGRLDSTNVIVPLCSIITDISADHKGILGDTVSSIAQEKAGIIKKDVPVITSNTDMGILTIIKDRSLSMNASCYCYNEDFYTGNIREDEHGYRFDYFLKRDTEKTEISNIQLGLPLALQIKNAALALTASLLIENNFTRLNHKIMREAFKDISIPGRFEYLNDNPTIIFDPAHNRSALSETLELMRKKNFGKEVIIVISLMKDKEPEELLSLTSADDAAIIYYHLDDDRCYLPSMYDVPSFIEGVVSDIQSLKNLLEKNSYDKKVILFTGTFRLYPIAVDFIRHTIMGKL